MEPGSGRCHCAHLAVKLAGCHTAATGVPKARGTPGQPNPTPIGICQFGVLQLVLVTGGIIGPRSSEQSTEFMPRQSCVLNTHMERV